MELPDKSISNNLINVKIYTYLLTSESDLFDESSEIKNIGSQEKFSNPEGYDLSNLVLTAFDVKIKMNDNLHKPSQNVKSLIEEGIQDSIIENREIRRLVSKADTEDVLNAYPNGIPETDSIRIAEFIVSPDEEGMIGKVELDELNRILS